LVKGDAFAVLSNEVEHSPWSPRYVSCIATL
jgi:hypothetical protein